MADLPADLVTYVDETKNDAIHAFTFLKESGTLSASLTFNVTHRAPNHDALIHVRFPSPWSKSKEVKVSVTKFSESPESILNEARLGADTVMHAHTPYLAGWSLAHKAFPILYVAAQRHFLAREIPNHLDRTRTILDVISERLDKHPELAPSPGILESNGGGYFWGDGVVRTAQLILLLEEGARYQAIAEQVGGAQPYTPGSLERQWKRTGLLEKSRAFVG